MYDCWSISVKNPCRAAWTSGVQRNAMHSAKEPNEMTQGMLLKTECGEK